MYFLFLLVKIKIVQKISQFSCFLHTSACFHAVVKPIRQILYHFQKRCIVEAIRYENRAEMFVLNGNKRPILYDFHYGVKPSWYNGNLVNTMFPLYRIGFYNVVKTMRYNGNRIRHTTLYSAKCFHQFSINVLAVYDFLFV